jgi:hypothetical protein
LLRIGHAALQQIRLYWEEEAESSRTLPCALLAHSKKGQLRRYFSLPSAEGVVAMVKSQLRQR